MLTVPTQIFPPMVQSPRNFVFSWWLRTLRLLLVGCCYLIIISSYCPPVVVQGFHLHGIRNHQQQPHKNACICDPGNLYKVHSISINHKTALAAAPPENDKEVFRPNSGGDMEEKPYDDIFRSIRGPLGNEDSDSTRLRPKRIFILSDSTGLMAKSAVEKTLAQFNGCGDERFFLVQESLRDYDNNNMENGDDGSSQDGDKEEEEDETSANDFRYDESCENISTKLYPFVKTEQRVASILKQAAEEYDALVVYTFADPLLREQTLRMCQLSQFGHVDLLSPMFDAMSALLNQQPIGASFQLNDDDNDDISALRDNKRNSQNIGSQGSNKNSNRVTTRRSLSDKYFRRIEAVEYTLKCDDGRNPKDWHQADLILCGVSRTGKTPLSVVLSQTMGLKVANIPLVVGMSPPSQLFDMDPNRVICLTLSLPDLTRIRRHRLRKMGTTGSRRRGGGAGGDMARSTYADPDYLQQDLEHAHQLALQYGFTEIDVTGRAVEETASYISAILNKRFPPQ